MCRFCIAYYANYNYSYNYNNSYNHKHNYKNKINIKYSYKRVRIFGRKMPRNPALFCLCVERPVEKSGESVENRSTPVQKKVLHCKVNASMIK